MIKGVAEMNTGNEGRQRIKKRLELGKMETGKRKILAVLLGVLLVCTMSGCRRDGGETETGIAKAADTSSHASVSTVTLTEGKYSEEKLDDTWDENQAVYLCLENDKITIEERTGLEKGDGAALKDKVEITKSTAVIKSAGTYVFSGTLKDGQIIVDVDKEETVRLVFNGVSLTCTSLAPVYLKGGNVIITLTEGTENTLEDGSVYEFEDEGAKEPKAAVFSKDDLTFNGTGTLHVIGNYCHGIQCKDDLKFISGTYIISAVNDGIVGKDSVSIRDGHFTIESGDDGIKASNTEDSDKGYVLIENGFFQIMADGDGIQAETLLRINGGDFEITTGDGGQNVKTVSDMHSPDARQGSKTGMLGDKGAEMEGRIPEGGMAPPEGDIPEGGMAPPEGDIPEGGMAPPEGDIPEGGMTPPEGDIPEGGMTPPKGDMPAHEDGESETVSTKGLKSYVELIIAGGEFNLDTQDDGIHSNQNVMVQGGSITVSTGDDGIHAEKTLIVDGGSIDIQKSYEGLEGFDIVIKDGDIKIEASDDGINAAGDSEAVTEEKKKDFMADEDQGASMTINGGIIYVNANGDGLDANGDIFIGGGEVTVHGPADGGNGTLDYAASCRITGGTLVAIGSIGMAQKPSEDSTQVSLVFQTDKAIEAGAVISLKDKEGNTLAETVTEKTAQWFAISSPNLSVGEEYIFCAGTAEKEVKPTQIVSQFSF